MRQEKRKEKNVIMNRRKKELDNHIKQDSHDSKQQLFVSFL
jgi:hypothetical protein